MSDAALVEIPEAALSAADHVMDDPHAMDMNRFNAEMADHIYTRQIQEHRRAGERSRLRATAGFFLNGQAVDVSFGLERLDAAVQAALNGA